MALKKGEQEKECSQSDLHSLLVSFWSIQNSILQSCRRMFVAAATIVLSSFSIGVALSRGIIALLALALGLLPAGLILAWLWGRVVEDRGYNDSYFRWQILKLENGQDVSPEVLTKFREWQEMSVAEKHYQLSSDHLGTQLLPSLTRGVLDKYLPAAYLVCCLILALLAAMGLVVHSARWLASFLLVVWTLILT